MTDGVVLASVLMRLEQLEAQNAIRNCINRYMEICDALDADTDLNELMGLFDRHSIWEGIGEKYSSPSVSLNHGKQSMTCSKAIPRKNHILS